MYAPDHPLAFDPHTALVVVDVQNDFADPAGGLYVNGGERVVPVINDLVVAAADAGATIIYTQDWHPDTTPHFAKDGGAWPVHCVQGTWGAELHPALTVAGPSITKGSGGEDGYSAFTIRDPVSGEERPTDLDAALRQRGVTHVVVCGLALDVCVLATVLDARRLGYEPIVVTDATRAVNLHPGDDQAALETMAQAGATLR